MPLGSRRSSHTHLALLSSAGCSGHWGLRGWGKAEPRGGPIPDPVGCSGAPLTTTTMTAQSVSRVLSKTHRARPREHTQQRLVSVSFPYLIMEHVSHPLFQTGSALFLSRLQ